MAKRAMTPEAKALKAAAIMEQAAAMFLALPYEKIKMSDIAKKMGMSNGILFVYFKTKESLFFTVLCREYEKRLARLKVMAAEVPVQRFEDFNNLIMNELMELVDTNPLYIKLESMRTAILERNVDAEIMLTHKVHLYRRLQEVVALICARNAVAPEDVVEIFQAEAAIITGCKQSTMLPDEVIDIIEQNGLDGLKRNFKADIRKTMLCYLDGYYRQYVATR